jgi:transposase
MRNHYLKRSHISEAKFRAIMRYFCLDLTATNTALISDISRNSINGIYALLRCLIALLSINSSPSSGEFELDESYFGARRVRGKRGRGAARKAPVFGILKHYGQFLAEIIKNCSKAQLMPIIQGNSFEGSTIHTKSWKVYDGLILNGYDHHRMYHSHDEFVREKSHVNGIKSFWSFAKRRLAKFNGLTDEKFILHLKECEFRFNIDKDEMFNILIKIIKKKHSKLV